MVLERSPSVLVHDEQYHGLSMQRTRLQPENENSGDFGRHLENASTKKCHLYRIYIARVPRDTRVRVAGRILTLASEKKKTRPANPAQHLSKLEFYGTYVLHSSDI